MSIFRAGMLQEWTRLPILSRQFSARDDGATTKALRRPLQPCVASFGAITYVWQHWKVVSMRKPPVSSLRQDCGAKLPTSIRAQVCQFFLAGKCSYGSRCRYDHVKPKAAGNPPNAGQLASRSALAVPQAAGPAALAPVPQSNAWASGAASQQLLAPASATRELAGAAAESAAAESAAEPLLEDHWQRPPAPSSNAGPSSPRLRGEALFVKEAEDRAAAAAEERAATDERFAASREVRFSVQKRAQHLHDGRAAASTTELLLPPYTSLFADCVSARAASLIERARLLSSLSAAN